VAVELVDVLCVRSLLCMLWALPLASLLRLSVAATLWVEMEMDVDALEE
jgi:hypothetical protein